MSPGRRRSLLLAAVGLIVLLGIATLLSTPGDGPSPDPPPSVNPAAGAPPPTRTETAAEGAEDPAESERRIERPVRITGRVKSVSGEPVPAGVKVHARYDQGDAIVIVRTDDAGRFELPEIPSGEVALFVHGGGWVSPGLVGYDWDRSSPFVVDVDAGEEEPRELIAEPAGSVAVTVLLPDGSPAAGAEVWVTFFTDVADGLRYPVRKEPAAGTFRIEDLVPGHSYEVCATAPGRAQAEFPQIVPASGHTQELTVELPHLREVVLHVLDADTGRPIEGVWIESDCCDRVATGNDGSVRIAALPPGVQWFQTSHQEYYRLDELELPAGAGGSHTLRMARGLRLSGRVLLSDGRPVRGGHVLVMPPDQLYEARLVELTESGEFAATGLPPGECKLSIDTDPNEKDVWWEKETVATAGQTGLVVRLGPGDRRGGDFRWVLVRVLFGGGDPVPTVDIHIEAGGKRTSGRSRKPDGVHGRDVPTGCPEVMLEVANACDEKGLPLALGATRVGPLSEDCTEVTVRLPAEKAISGVVRGAGGKGLPGILVSAHPAGRIERDLRSWPHRTVRTDANGRFLLGGLWEGSYAIEVDAPDGWFRPASPPVFRSGATGCEIHLEAAESLALTVIGPRLKPVPRVHVDLHRMERHGPGEDDWSLAGCVTKGMTDAKGRVLLRGLVPAALHAAVLYPPPYGSAAAVQFEPDLTPGEATVRLLPAVFVTARLEGEAPDDVVVWGKGRGPWRRAHREGGRLFRLGPVPGGAVRLMALPSDERPGDREREVVEAKPGVEAVLRLSGVR